MAASVFRFIRNEKGRALNHALAGTGQLTLLYGVLVSVGLILPRLFSLL
jgi:hypothetical protein